ncbi:MAG: RdgB/HAM1 family non-canonical purine NTP pyrophosphatase [Thermomicrobiales bacterium]
MAIIQVGHSFPFLARQSITRVADRPSTWHTLCTYGRCATVVSLVLATNNAGKMREFAALLADLPVRLISARDAGVLAFPPETGETFAANARAKAVYVTGETGLPAIADDSGLVVDALGGAPGIYSARYGGPDATDADRCTLLLHALRDVPPEARAARFVAAIALSLPDGTVIATEGRLEGAIADAARGVNGFGYDPIFLVADYGRTLAEFADDEKNGISHRARALAALRPQLLAVLPRLEG